MRIALGHLGIALAQDTLHFAEGPPLFFPARRYRIARLAAMTLLLLNTVARCAVRRRRSSLA